MSPLSTEYNKASHAIIVGAGLAGCQMAYELSNRGWRVTLLDKNSALASQASGNCAAITYPTVSSTPLAVSRLAVSGYKYIYEILQTLSDVRHGVCGAIKILPTEEERIRWKRALINHDFSGEWAEAVDAKNASEISGISIVDEAIYLKRAMWIDIPDYCKHLIASSRNIEWLRETEVIDFGSDWIKTSKQERINADRIIFCGAYEISKLEKLSWIPFRTVRGQLVTVKTALSELKTILCFDGFATPDLGNGTQQLGATYDRELKDLTAKGEDNDEIISKFKSIAPSANISSASVVSAWTQYRTNVAGMEPIIGPAHLATGEEIPNVFILAAFASKGLVYIPSGARDLAALISGENISADLSRFSLQRFTFPAK